MLMVDKVTKIFNKGTPNEKLAISDLSLTLDDGDFVTVIGSNGAGKSTLMNLISGTYYPEKGQILLDDELITYIPQHKRSRFIGRLFQDPLQGTAPSMTIEENMALAYLRADGKQGVFSRITKEDRNFFKERLSTLELGLEDRLDSEVGLLSGGQRQALTLLMATIVTPKVLLLDEHTAALDPATAEKVLGLTSQIVKENNITCMMITHNITSALEVGNRTIMMNDGKVLLDIKGEERDRLEVPDLLELFSMQAGKALDNDRILLS